ncbi:MAG: hypothetical protein IBX69_11350 [Anaerolineales bacterium]|nr:hypothetical protein [Anaerolineales bacterium]
MVSSIIRGQAVISELLQNGQGYSGSQWETSMTIASLQSLPSGPLYSNRPGAIYLLADRHSYTIPYFIPGRDDEYHDELEDMKNKMQHEGALLILFEEDRHPPESLRMEELTRHLVLSAEYSDGAIYAFPTGD